MRGAILDLASFDAGDLDRSRLDQSLEHWSHYQSTREAQVASRISGAQVVVTNKVPLSTETLNGAEHLKLIVIAATGTNIVDLSAASALGITVCNVRDYAAASLSQHTFALILALRTHLFEYRAAVRDGRWNMSPHFCLLDFPIEELEHSVLGIVGFGNLGQRVADLGAAFGMRVMIAQRPGKPGLDDGRHPLDQVLKEADVLSLHCPLTPDTEGLIGANELRSMKNNAILINTARGGIVDETALAQALLAGDIGGAGIDVLTTEPPRDGNVLLDPGIPNLIVTPHNAWAGHRTRQRLADEVADNIAAYRNGAPRNVVNP